MINGLPWIALTALVFWIVAIFCNAPVRCWVALCAAKCLMRDYRATIKVMRTHYGLRCHIVSRYGVGTLHWDGWRLTKSPGTWRYGKRRPPRWW